MLWKSDLKLTHNEIVFPVIPKLRQVHFSKPSNKTSLQVVFLGPRELPRNRRIVLVFLAQPHRSLNNPAALRTPPRIKEDCSDRKI